MKSPASRKSAERQRRKDAGEVRLEFWMTKADIESLDFIVRERGTDRAEAISFALFAGRCFV